MEIRIRCRTNNQGEYFLRLKAFNSPIDTTHLLPRLSTDWECSVHSYVLNLQGSSANPEVEVMRLNCNAIEFDRSLKQQHLIKVLVNTVKMQHVKTFRWKKIIVSNPTNFQVSLTDLRNTPVNVKNYGSHALLIFRKKVQIHDPVSSSISFHAYECTRIY